MDDGDDALDLKKKFHGHHFCYYDTVNFSTLSAALYKPRARLREDDIMGDRQINSSHWCELFFMGPKTNRFFYGVNLYTH